MEKKLNATKGKKEEQAQPHKYSYEEVVRIANELQAQGQKLFNDNQQLRKQLETYQQLDYWRRLMWLWKCMVGENPYLTKEFKEQKAKEFMFMMTPQGEEVPDKNSEQPSAGKEDTKE